MRTQVIWAIVLVLVVGVIGYMTMGDEQEDTDDTSNGTEEMAQTEALFDELPYEMTVRGRTITFDRDTVEQTQRSEYAELPYEVTTIDGETQLVESQVAMESGETPIEFVERFVERELPREEELSGYPNEIYTYSVSFYEMSEEEVEEYPADDSADSEAASEGVSAYVELSNLPDDAVGGEENRFDFIVTSNDAWVLVWQGERTFCRRRGEGYWQPASELCP